MEGKAHSREAQLAALHRLLEGAEKRASAAEDIGRRIAALESALERQIAARQAADQETARLRAELTAQNEQLLRAEESLARNSSQLDVLLDRLGKLVEKAAPAPPSPPPVVPERPVRPSLKPLEGPLDLSFARPPAPPSRGTARTVRLLLVILVAALGWLGGRRLLTGIAPRSATPAPAAARELPAGNEPLELALAGSAMEQGDFVRAESIYRTFLRTQPGDEPALRGLAQALLRQDRVEESAALLRSLQHPAGDAPPNP